MPSLSDRLKSLGVKVGTQNLPPPKPQARVHHPIDSVLPGDWWETPHGEIFVVETRYNADFKVGAVELKLSAPLDMMAAWGRDPRMNSLALEQFAFLDTETTGLAGGSGTYTFLVGIGRFEGDEFRLVQFFLQDPAEEPAQLAAIEAFLAPCQAVVTYNGKSFDIPLLNTRYITNGWPPPLVDISHLDLLHLARRLWKARLPSRTLGDLEVKILGTQRSEHDVPGWMVADLYFDYLHTGDARPLRGVFYHNEVDVVSLAALLNHMATWLANPLTAKIEHGLDILSIGKLYADLGRLDIAAQIYQRGLGAENLPATEYWEGLKRLSYLHKKRGDLPAALTLWKQAASAHHIYAHVELAMVSEHKNRDFATALHWTQTAIEIVTGPKFSGFKREVVLPELEHRLKRLERKMRKSPEG